jgi:TonB family protein
MHRIRYRPFSRSLLKWNLPEASCHPRNKALKEYTIAEGLLVAIRIQLQEKDSSNTRSSSPLIWALILSGAVHAIALISVFSCPLMQIPGEVSSAHPFVHVRISSPGTALAQPKHSFTHPATRNPAPTGIPGRNIPAYQQDLSGEEPVSSPTLQAAAQPSTHDPSHDGADGAMSNAKAGMNITTKASPVDPMRALYPEYSNLHRQQGEVIIRYKVDTLGIPFDIRIMRSSGYERLDHAAVEAVRNTRFIPALRDENIPVISEREDTFTFIHPGS